MGVVVWEAIFVHHRTTPLPNPPPQGSLAGEGWGGGWQQAAEYVVTPLPVPPPQGGRERCGASHRFIDSVFFFYTCPSQKH